MNDTRKHRIQPRMTRVARKLRRDMTGPERALWHLLRSRGLNGLKFRRQHPIGPFVADFYCAQAKLVVEVDGLSHEDADADSRRQAYIEAQGMRVFRVSNDDVLKHRVAVMDAVLAAAEEQRTALDPHPNPLPEREREPEGPAET